MPDFYPHRFIKNYWNEGGYIECVKLYGFTSAKSNLKYLVRVEIYPHKIYVLKFFPKNFSNSPNRLLTNHYEPRRIIYTCINILNDNLEKQTQALYKSWFVDFEPFKGGKFVDSELGEIPEGWRVGKLMEIAEIIMGQSPQGRSFNELGDGVVFYQGRTEFGDRFPSVRLYTTEPSRFAESLSVLLSVRAPVGDINVVFGSINRSSLENMQIVIPPSDIIERFERVAQKIDMKILNSFNELNSLKEQRDILLPKLMSGKLIINDLC